MVPIQLDSNQSFTIGLWDRDTGSANDVLGYQHFIPGQYRFPYDDNFLVFSEHEGSWYQMKIKILPGTL